jgi:hypothetical protein
VVGDFFKRLVNGVGFLLAALTFFLVPIGRRTAAQHVVAILSAPPAREAASAFGAVARRVSAQALAELERLRNPPLKAREPRPIPAKGKAAVVNASSRGAPSAP